jgi:hypothetical protein
LNSQELSAVIEASILELYSSLDCTVKVLHAVYGHGSRSFPKSTRKLFHNYDKVTGSFPEELKEVFRTADWYDGLRYLRDELTHLDRFRRLIDDLIRERKKDAEEFIARAKASIAAAALDED